MSKRPSVTLAKSNKDTSYWKPFEEGVLTVRHTQAASVSICDSENRIYLNRRVRPGAALRFSVRGSAGRHEIQVLNKDEETIASESFVLKPKTEFSCNRGPYAKVAQRIELLLRKNAEARGLLINGKLHRMLVTWGRDHVHTLKAMKYMINDVQSGMDYWMKTQEKTGMLWDCIHPNPNYPHPTWFGEALGKGWFRYDDNMKYIVRRIPIEADVEFLYVEGVWYAWKASGDDEWMKKQLPTLEKALKYNSSHPHRWSKKHKLVRRSFCMDSWDFANPHYCNGDHRRINPGDPQFLFHSDNSGLYSIYWRLAEMQEAAGDQKRAKELRKAGEEFRKRANKKLFFKNIYGHMIPEKLPEKEVYDLVGDERKRMSLSTGYTLNRKLPTHAMAVKVLKEYQRRGREKKKESFAEWWTMDPPYSKDQWPSAGPPWGEYMNGAICTIIAGEIAKAAFDHGMEDYGVDIIDRVWKLSERDGGDLHQVYRRLPENPTFPKGTFKHVELRSVVNRGLKHKACKGVKAWTDEGTNDLRNLPVGKRRFGIIEFDVIDPKKNCGKSVLHISADSSRSEVSSVTIPVDSLTGKSIYFMHACGRAVPVHAVACIYTVMYADGSEERVEMRMNDEIGSWWGISDAPDLRNGRPVLDREVAQVAWSGANPQWKNVGMFMTGWNNPRPDVPVTAIRAEAADSSRAKGDVLLAGISISDQEVKFEERIRSGGLPDSWAQGAVYYAIAEGLAGVEDAASKFKRVKVAPRWAATESTKADVTLHYPASDGYCSYKYQYDAGKKRIRLELTGSFDEAEVHCLLPKGRKAKKVIIGNKELSFKTSKIEKSNYVDFKVKGIPDRSITIEC